MSQVLASPVLTNRNPPVGRTRERERVTAALHSGRGVVIVGPAGVGKTHVAAAAVDIAADPASAAWTVATASMRAVSYGALSWLLAAGDPPLHLAEAVARLGATLAERAGGRRPLLVIDDAHYLDDRSADVVLQLAATGAVTLLVTSRDGRLPSGLGALVSDGFVERVELAPFDRAATAAVVASLMGGPVADATVERLWRWSGGVALLLSALVEEGRRAYRFHRREGRWWWEGPRCCRAGRRTISPAPSAR